MDFISCHSYAADIPAGPPPVQVVQLSSNNGHGFDGTSSGGTIKDPNFHAHN